MLARFYVLSNRILRAVKRKSPGSLHRVLKLGIRAIWLGLLERKHLHWLDERFWEGESLFFDRYQDDIYCDEDFNLGGLFAWEAAAIEEFFSDSNRLLVASAGGGREVIALRRMSFEVDGFECNQKLLSFGNSLLERVGLDADIRLAPRDECPDFGCRYDGLIVGWGAYDLIQGRARWIAFLRGLRNRAREGAPVLLSFFTRSPESRRFKITAAIASYIRWILRRERVEEGDILEPIYFHFFTEEELRLELRAGGFDLKLFTTEGYGHAVGAALRRPSVDPDVSRLIHRYFDAWSSKDMDGYRDCFHPKATVHCLGGGRLSTWSLDRFIAVQRRELEKAPWREIPLDIRADMDGPISRAVVDWRLYDRDRPTAEGVDYFTLADTPRGWKIVHLVFRSSRLL